MRELVWAPGDPSVSDYLLRGLGPPISAHARLVYLTLFSYMGEDCRCFPSVPTLMRGTELSERTVQRRLDELEAAGLMQREIREGRATVYRLFAPWNPRQADTPVRLTPPSEGHPRHSDTGVRVTPTPVTLTPTPVTLTPEGSQEDLLPNDPAAEQDNPPAGAAREALPVEAVDEELQAGWQQVLAVLQPQTSRVVYETWMAPLVPVARNGPQLLLGIPPDMDGERLLQKHALKICQALRDVTGGRIRAIGVRVRGEPP